VKYPTYNERKVNWAGHIMCRKCLLEHGTEGTIDERIKVTERQGKKCYQLLDKLRECKDTRN
jgi:hypothetical protein